MDHLGRIRRENALAENLYQCGYPIPIIFKSISPCGREFNVSGGARTIIGRHVVLATGEEYVASSNIKFAG
jgi:hypothetical protein